MVCMLLRGPALSTTVAQQLRRSARVACSLPRHAQLRGTGSVPATNRDDLGRVWDILETAVEDRLALFTEVKAQREAAQHRIELLSTMLHDEQVDNAELRDQISHLRKDLQVFTASVHEEIVNTRTRIQRKGVVGRGGQSRMAYRPELSQAWKQPAHACELHHDKLAELAMLGNHSAHRERLLREIMSVDQVSWGKAHDVLYELDEFNERWYWIETLPYRIGIAAAMVGGAGSILLVFCGPLAHWYAENVAGEDLPEDVEHVSELSINQVGSWTWAWMEPMIGVASFIILCCQASRAQMLQMNMRTYGDRILASRADRLANHFAKYDRSMVRSWAKELPEVEYNYFPTYERAYSFKGPASGL